MADIVRVRSHAHLPIRVVEPHPNPEKPGDSPVLRSVVLRPGVNELSASDAEAYRAWAGTKPGLMTDGVVAELMEDEPDMSFGFEPALEAASKNGAAEGSRLKDKGPVSSADMKPTSDAPNDDSPRSQSSVSVAMAPAAPPPAALPVPGKK